MAVCGARTRGGHSCKNRGMENGRCRMHGGKNTGAPKGNQNARVHGIYSDAIGGDEHELWGQIEIGNLDVAIRVAHLQLRRAMIAQSKSDSNDGLDVDARIIRQSTKGKGGDADGAAQQVIIERRRRPYEDIINRLLGRIGDLEAKRAEIINKAGHAGDMSTLLSDLIEKLPS